MADFGSALWNKPPSGDTGEGGGASDPVTRSLRFDQTSRLSRSTGSTNTTWTLSFWVKRALISGPYESQYLACWAISGSSGEGLAFRGTYDSSNLDKLSLYNGSTHNYSDRVFRDPSAWAHICISVNSGTGTVYYNGESVISGVSGIQAWGNMRLAEWLNDANEFDGYMADVYGIEGSALDHTSFTTSNNYGGLKPASYTGSFGTNGFHLKFEDSSDIGADDAGSNDFTATNLSSHDVMLDTPTKNHACLNGLAQSTYSLSNGNLECIRDASSAQSYATSTIGVNASSATTSKWYWEVYAKTISSDYPRVGISSYYSRGGDEPTTNYLCGDTDGTGRAWASKNGSGNIVGESHPGMKFDGSNSGSAFVDYDQGDILQFALDLENNKLWCGKNGTWYTDDASTTTTGSAIAGNTATPAFSDLSGHTWGPAIFCNANADVFILNAGADPSFAGNYSGTPASSEWAYSPPTGFQSLNSSNLTAAVTPSEHFGILTYVGNSDLYYGSGSTQNVTGVNFDVGMAWIKDRDNSAESSFTGSGSDEYGNYLFDTITGTSTGGYNIDADVISSSGGPYLNSGEYGVTSFSAGSGTSRGITVDEAGETNYYYDEFGFYQITERYVAWLWKLGSTGSSSTWNSSYTAPTTEHYNDSAGVTTIQVSPASSGNLEVAHSLGAAPEFFFVADDQGYANFSGFPAFHKDLSSGNYLQLDGNSGQSSDSTYFPSGAAHADYIKLGSAFIDDYGYGFNLRIWAFTGVEGYSKFGKYNGNGISDGPMVYTGFRPALVMMKKITASGAWHLFDNKRSGYNYANDVLQPDSSAAELSGQTYEFVDLLSNGFKVRRTTHGPNSNGQTYIYAAFSESPFSKSLAR